MSNIFGSLTFNEKNNTALESESQQIDYLFRNTAKSLVDMTVIDSERQIAFENLKKLTTELETKRLRYKAKSACKYFTL